MAEALAGHTGQGGGRRGSRWRMAVWGLAAVLWLLPALAMLVTEELQWSLGDFVVWGAMLAIAGATYELGALLSGNSFYRAGFGVAIVAGFLLVWVNLAVGIIGSEDNPANLLFFGVLAIGGAGALIARFRARGMAWALVATAVAHAAVAIAALLGGLDSRPNVLMLNAFFVLVWLVSATLFHHAASGRLPAAAAD